ncbi:MAG: helix-hairpin-helix domain-containing protein [Fibromonadaceae bacterium]|jgi:competence protein ComEA|nr:helix-hairpin-helix domain-containing protein [Fibromonadaceae bacterium]
MNSAEKSFLCLALFLFALGGISRLGFFSEISPLESVFLPVNEVAVIDTINAIDTVVNELVADKEEVAKSVKHTREKKPKKKAPAFPLPINTASNEDLCFIKGVGPSLAQKIIDYREKNGNFRTAKDLEKVPGIGAKKRQAMEEFVRFD